MNSMQIENILKRNCHTKKYFTGVYSSNTIPKLKKFPYCFVANTDKAGTVGDHWISCYVKNSKTVEYFDSFGEKPNEDLTKYLSNFNKIKLNKYRIQHPSSDSCGFYCIYFIVNKCLGVKFKTIIKTLYETRAMSDMLVKFFVIHFMGK